MESIYLILKDYEDGFSALTYTKTVEEAFIIKKMLINRYIGSTFKIIEVNQVKDDDKCMDTLLQTPIGSVINYANSKYDIEIDDNEEITISKK